MLRYGLDLHASFIRERVARARTASDRLEALIDAYVDFYSQYSSFTHVAIAETARLRPADDSAPMGMLGPLVEVTAETLADARQAGLLREIDPDICLSAFLGLVSSVPVFYAATNRRPAPDRDETLAQNDLLDRGTRHIGAAIGVDGPGSLRSQCLINSVGRAGLEPATNGL